MYIVSIWGVCVCVCARTRWRKKGRMRTRTAVKNSDSLLKFRYLLCGWLCAGDLVEAPFINDTSILLRRRCRSCFQWSLFFSLRSVCLVRNCIGHHVHRYHVMSVLNECSTFRFSYQFALYFVDAKWFVLWQMRGSKIESKKCNCIRYSYWSRLDRLAHVGTHPVSIRATCCRTVSSRDVFIN